MTSVSIVIPARHAAETIGATLDAALGQIYEGRVEVIVAIPPGDDATRAAASSRGVRIVENPEGTAPSGLNAAIAASSGDVIVRCDAHAVLPPSYVRRAVATLQRTGAGNVGGVQRAEGETLLERAIAIAQTTPLGVGDARYRLGGPAGPVETVYLGVYPRSVLEQVGGFDERYRRNQDYELNHRIRLAGREVWFDPSLEVAYRVRSSLRTLAGQYFDYGAGKRRMLRNHPDSLRPRQVAAPLLVAALAASAAISFTPWRRASIIVPAAYGAVLCATGAVLAVRRRDLAGVAVPAVLATMHLSWGAGFFRG